jgi:hypothetical protein
MKTFRVHFYDSMSVDVQASNPEEARKHRSVESYIKRERVAIKTVKVVKQKEMV